MRRGYMQMFPSMDAGAVGGTPTTVTQGKEPPKTKKPEGEDQGSKTIEKSVWSNYDSNRSESVDFKEGDQNSLFSRSDINSNGVDFKGLSDKQKSNVQQNVLKSFDPASLFKTKLANFNSEAKLQTKSFTDQASADSWGDSTAKQMDAKVRQDASGEAKKANNEIQQQYTKALQDMINTMKTSPEAEQPEAEVKDKPPEGEDPKAGDTGKPGEEKDPLEALKGDNKQARVYDKAGNHSTTTTVNDKNGNLKQITNQNQNGDDYLNTDAKFKGNNKGTVNITGQVNGQDIKADGNFKVGKDGTMTSTIKGKVGDDSFKTDVKADKDGTQVTTDGKDGKNTNIYSKFDNNTDNRATYKEDSSVKQQFSSYANNIISNIKIAGMDTEALKQFTENFDAGSKFEQKVGNFTQDAKVEVKDGEDAKAKQGEVNTKIANAIRSSAQSAVSDIQGDFKKSGDAAAKNITNPNETPKPPEAETEPEPPKAGPTQPKNVTVRQGETLNGIARNNGTDATSLYNDNQTEIENAAVKHGEKDSQHGKKLFAGTKLNIT